MSVPQPAVQRPSSNSSNAPRVPVAAGLVSPVDPLRPVWHPAMLFDVLIWRSGDVVLASTSGNAWGVRAHLWINRVEGAARKPDPDYDRVDAGAVLVCSDRDGSHRSCRSPRWSHPDRGRPSATTVRSQSPLRHPEDHATRTAAEPVPKSACSPFAVRDGALAVPRRDDRRVDRSGDRYSAALCSASCRNTERAARSPSSWR